MVSHEGIGTSTITIPSLVTSNYEKDTPKTSMSSLIQSESPKINTLLLAKSGDL